jgi:hypothetical protein
MSIRLKKDFIQNSTIKNCLTNRINVIHLVFPNFSKSNKNKDNDSKNFLYSNYVYNIPLINNNSNNNIIKNKKILTNKSTNTDLFNYSPGKNYLKIKKNSSDNILLKNNYNFKNYFNYLKSIKPKIFDYLNQKKVPIIKPKIKKPKFIIKNPYEIKLNIFSLNENNFLKRNKNSKSFNDFEYLKTSNFNNKFLENIKKNFYINNIKNINYKINSNRNSNSKYFHLQYKSKNKFKFN